MSTITNEQAAALGAFNAQTEANDQDASIDLNELDFFDFSNSQLLQMDPPFTDFLNEPLPGSEELSEPVQAEEDWANIDPLLLSGNSLVLPFRSRSPAPVVSSSSPVNGRGSPGPSNGISPAADQEEACIEGPPVASVPQQRRTRASRRVRRSILTPEEERENSRRFQMREMARERAVVEKAKAFERVKVRENRKRKRSESHNEVRNLSQWRF